MAGEWHEVPFQQLLSEPVRNGIYKPKDFPGRGAKIVNMGELFARRSLVAEGAGKCIVVLNVEEPTTFESSIIRARPDTVKVEPLFLYYFFNSTVGLHRLDTIRRQVAVAGITGNDLSQLKIPVPSLPEQRAIAHILGTLDDKIELNRRMKETLEAMARALFKSWFVDFDPVRAKAEGRDPGLPKPLADLFPERLVESELGQIPEGWDVRTLGDVAEHPRRTVRPTEIDPETPYIALEHMPKRSIALADWEHSDGLESNKFAFNHGEILFGKLLPYFHKIGVAPLDGICSTDIVVVGPKATPWFGFVLSHASSINFVDYTNAGSTGTKMSRTSWTEMARYEIVLPPERVAKEFSELIQPAVDRIIEAIHESRTLAVLRDTLRPKLISGELRVAAAEKILENAL